MARPRALTKKWSRDRVREHRQREKDRAELMAVFSAACPKGIGEHIGIRIELEGGEPRLVWNLDDVGAAFLNEFAASIITDPNTGGAGRHHAGVEPAHRQEADSA